MFIFVRPYSTPELDVRTLADPSAHQAIASFVIYYGATVFSGGIWKRVLFNYPQLFVQGNLPHPPPSGAPLCRFRSTPHDVALS